MANLTDLLVSNNRISAPVIATVLGVFFVYLSIFIPYVLFVVPVETFLVFHFLKIYRIKIRILASLVVFLAVAIIAAAMFAQIVDSNSGHAPAVQLSNGSIVQTSISPYHGPSNDFNYSFIVSGNTTIAPYWMNVSSSTSSTFHIYVPQSLFHEVRLANGSLLIYVHLSNISDSGVYYYNLFLANSTSLYVANIGPVMISYISLWAIEMISYIPGYLILFELIFLVGIFIGRSMSNSIRYSRSRQPPPSQ